MIHMLFVGPPAILRIRCYSVPSNAAVQRGDADAAQTIISALRTSAPKLGWTNEDIDSSTLTSEDRSVTRFLWGDSVKIVSKYDG